MNSTRRSFLRLSMAAGAAAALGSVPAARSFARSAPVGGAKLKLLILGGTGFLGPHTINAAIARGHTVTVFNRGKTEKRKKEVLGIDAIPDTVERLSGNRDPEKHAEETDLSTPKGLSALEGDREWDAVIDNSGYVPRIVKASADLLAPRVKQYVFISTVSVYAQNSEPLGDESRALATMPDPKDENVQAFYGALKALCEQAAEASMPGRATNIRPGLIVGPGDPTDRFTYWPVRVARGGRVLAPGTPDDPIQLIDVRDLADWIVHLVEQRTMGVFHALGPKTGLTMGGVLDACKAASGSDATFTWAPGEFLATQGVAPWSSMPVWIPPEGEMAGFHRWNCDKAVAAGLRFRPIVDSCKATLDWWNTLPEDRRNTLRAGITAEKEAEVLQALDAKP